MPIRRQVYEFVDQLAFTARRYNIPQSSLDYQICDKLRIMRLLGEVLEYTVTWPQYDLVSIDFVSSDDPYIPQIIGWKFEHLMVESSIEANLYADYDRAMRGI